MTRYTNDKILINIECYVIKFFLAMDFFSECSIQQFISFVLTSYCSTNLTIAIKIEIWLIKEHRSVLQIIPELTWPRCTSSSSSSHFSFCSRNTCPTTNLTMSCLRQIRVIPSCYCNDTITSPPLRCTRTCMRFTLKTSCSIKYILSIVSSTYSQLHKTSFRKRTGISTSNYDVNNLCKRIFACCVGTRGLDTLG
jgi:hypothetical protein